MGERMKYNPDIKGEDREASPDALHTTKVVEGPEDSSFARLGYEVVKDDEGKFVVQGFGEARADENGESDWISTAPTIETFDDEETAKDRADELINQYENGEEPN